MITAENLRAQLKGISPRADNDTAFYRALESCQRASTKGYGAIEILFNGRFELNHPPFGNREQEWYEPSEVRERLEARGFYTSYVNEDILLIKWDEKKERSRYHAIYW